MTKQDLVDCMEILAVSSSSASTISKLLNEKDVLQDNSAGLVKEILNPNMDFSSFSDQIIKWELSHNTGELDKLPD